MADDIARKLGAVNLSDKEANIIPIESDDIQISWMNVIAVSSMDIWIQAWNIPINWISAEVGLKIGKAFLAVKDVLVPHTARTKKIVADLKYERLGGPYCGILGHQDKLCENRTQDFGARKLADGAYGDWLQAPDNPASLATFSNSSSASDNPHMHTQVKVSKNPLQPSPFVSSSKDKQPLQTQDSSPPAISTPLLPKRVYCTKSPCII
ncbi:solute carrier family 12 member 1 [Striga asiatica]|uniref:Solute carrier family 12 member 1 n=1 Tax=Striga asiatica TaxID=4170 RepID=A0A5A7QWZ2_STRAF|nr:solute carrier family 12 member 1 [Striga asiatica]